MAQDFLTNSSHALFLNPSDNPNNVLVSNLLDGRNYGHWKRAMEVALIGKNKIDFVQGTLPKPDSSNPLLQAQWDRCDNMVLAWIMHATIKNFSDSIMFSTTSQNAWLELEERYGQADGTRIFEVQRDLCSIAQNNLYVADYFTEKLWDEYNAITMIPQCSCGLECASLKVVHKMLDNQQLMQFLIGLNDAYKNVRGNLIMMRPLPSLNQAYNVILQEEKQRGLSAVPHIVEQSTAFQAQFQSENRFANSLGGPSHAALLGQQRNAYNSKPRMDHAAYRTDSNSSNFVSKNDRRQYFCEHCKIYGHTIQRCYKIHGFPPGHKLHKGKRYAAAVQSNQVAQIPDSSYDSQAASNSGAAAPVPGLTADQYAQLIALLKKETAEDLGTSHAGFMAEKSTEKTFLSCERG